MYGYQTKMVQKVCWAKKPKTMNEYIHHTRTLHSSLQQLLITFPQLIYSQNQKCCYLYISLNIVKIIKNKIQAESPSNYIQVLRHLFILWLSTSMYDFMYGMGALKKPASYTDLGWACWWWEGRTAMYAVSGWTMWEARVGTWECILKIYKAAYQHK